MPTLIARIGAVILLYSLLQMFRAANPVILARAIKIGGGVVALAVAAFTGIKGELAVAMPLGILGPLAFPRHEPRPRHRRTHRPNRGRARRRPFARRVRPAAADGDDGRLRRRKRV